MIDAIIFRVSEDQFMCWPVDPQGQAADTGNMFTPDDPTDSYFQLKYDQIVLASLYKEDKSEGSTDHMWVSLKHREKPIDRILDIPFDDFKTLTHGIINDFKRTRLH
ncbi:MAG: hypothetical protein QXN55_00815 [Candidatus Nitrosotenuis sp.]